MRSEEFIFDSRDDTKLSGRLEFPAGEPRATAIFAHCFTCSKDFIASRRIARRLAENGIAVLRFDFTGLGHSEGEFANETFSSNTDDLVAAADALRDYGMPPALLVGHSLGGAAVIAAAGRIEEVRAVATIGAPADPAHVVHQFEDRREQIEREGQAEVSLAGRPFTIRKSFLDDVANTRLDDRLAKLGCAFLVMHSPLDATVGVENASRLFIAAKHPKSFISLDDADHLLTRPADAEYAADTIAVWASQYLPPVASVPSPKAGVHVRELDTKGFFTAIDAPRDRHIWADEPVRVGGTDRGFSPFELVGAGLGACTSMTMRMYANRKGWNVDAAQIDVTWEQADRHNSTFRRTIHLSGDLTEEQRTRLIEIADRCPVHRMLEGTVTIETQAASDD